MIATLRLRLLASRPGRWFLRILRYLRDLSRPTEVRTRATKRFVESFPPARVFRREPPPPNSLAVVIPCYRHAAFLPTTLTSVLAQTRRPDEVIFVVDCSPDETRGIVDAFIRDHDSGHGWRLRLLENERNLGQSASLNRGIEAAESELIMVLNDDDYLMHDAVETVLGLFSLQPEIVLLGANHIPFTGDESLRTALKTIAESTAQNGIQLEVSYPRQARRYRRYDDLRITHSGSTFLKAAWLAVGGYYPDKDRRIIPFSDRDFQLRVNALFPVAISPVISFSFWRSNSSVDGGVNS